jgi:hypothetical protein
VEFGDLVLVIYVCTMISLNRLFCSIVVSLVDAERVSHHFAAPLLQSETRLRATGVDFSPVFTRKFAIHSTLITAQSKLNRAKHGVITSFNTIILQLSRVGGRLTIAKTITRHFLFNIIDIIGKSKLIRGDFNAFRVGVVVDHSQTFLA